MLRALALIWSKVYNQCSEVDDQPLYRAVTTYVRSTRTSPFSQGVVYFGQSMGQQTHEL